MIKRLGLLLILGSLAGGCTCFASIGESKKRAKPEPQPESMLKGTKGGLSIAQGADQAGMN